MIQSSDEPTKERRENVSVELWKQERTIPHSVKFAQFYHDESNVSRLVEKEFDLLQLQSHQTFMEPANIEKVRLDDQFGGL